MTASMTETPQRPSAASAGSRRILVVEDQPTVQLVVTAALERDGFEVDAVADGSSAIEVLTTGSHVLVTLDVGLPGGDGLTLLRQIRHISNVPVIMLTGRTSEIDRVVGLEMGADDYLTKPFSGRELVARVRAVLRRTEREASAQVQNPPDASGPPDGQAGAATSPGHDGNRQRLEFGDLVIDFGTREAIVAGRRIETTRREFDLLGVLAASPRQVFTREQLLRAVWGSSSEWQAPSTVTEHMRRLRSKLEADASRPRWLETARGVGYRFVP